MEYGNFVVFLVLNKCDNNALIKREMYVFTMWASTVNKANKCARLYLTGCVSSIMREKNQPVQNRLQLQGDCVAHILYKCPTQCLLLSCTL